MSGISVLKQFIDISYLCTVSGTWCWPNPSWDWHQRTAHGSEQSSLSLWQWFPPWGGCRWGTATRDSLPSWPRPSPRENKHRRHCTDRGIGLNVHSPHRGRHAVQQAACLQKGLESCWEVWPSLALQIFLTVLTPLSALFLCFAPPRRRWAPLCIPSLIHPTSPIFQKGGGAHNQPLVRRRSRAMH